MICGVLWGFEGAFEGCGCRNRIIHPQFSRNLLTAPQVENRQLQYSQVSTREKKEEDDGVKNAI